MQHQENTNAYTDHPYAHSNSTGDHSTWEPLSDHLIAVAHAASRRAQIFGAEAMAYAAGLLHDVGKAHPGFQAYLTKSGPRHPHSTAGAGLADRLLPWPLSRMLAFGIAGHHAGLPNALPGRHGGTSLSERLRAEVDTALPAWLDAPSISREDIPPLLKGRGAQTPFAAQFLTRMIFSTLVDADRAETARYYGQKGEATAPSLDAMKMSLDAHLSTLGATADGPINTSRKHILEAAREGAMLDPGLFSMSVPTGGGKTLASLSFALDHAIRHGMRRVIYVVPYTSIIEQTAEVFRSILGDDAVLEHHSSFDTSAKGKSLPSHKEAAETWDAPIIVTTAVQFFESLFANRTTKCRKLHRIARSVVILDEAQSLPLDLLRPCLAAIRELATGYGTSLVLCTATQPAILKEDGFRAPEAFTRDIDAPLPVREIAPEPSSLHDTLRRTQIFDLGDLRDADLAQRIATHEQCLIIVNSRAHARHLTELCGNLDGICHLSTSMTPAHRRQVLSHVRQQLKAGASIRLIATSLVEAGVDVDFPVVYRAIAGLDSITQAAGRCNREGKLSDLGSVFVFRPDSAFPPPRSMQPLIQATEQVLGQHDDPVSPTALREWFLRVYWGRDDQMDTARVAGVTGILKAIDQGCAGGHFDIQFADIAKAFRMIEDGATPVVIIGEFGIDQKQLEALAKEDSGQLIASQMQQAQVQIPQKALDRLITQGRVAPWREQVFADQFLILIDPRGYDPVTGLDWQESAPS